VAGLATRRRHEVDGDEAIKPAIASLALLVDVLGWDFSFILRRFICTAQGRAVQ